ncbi:hypothetical protein Tco_1126296 [Tanacetum coccineum]
MYYPRFTKAIIYHFITKDKSISMRNRMFLHTAQDDSILGPMRFVSKSDDFQVYGALLLNRMTNQQMRDSTAYKTYLAYATDTPGVSVSKKKAPAKADEARELKKALKRSKRETNIHQVGGSSKGADSESEVLDEPKGKSIDISE